MAKAIVKKTDVSFQEEIGRRLFRLREYQKHMSPEAVATRAAENGYEVSASYIRRLEKGLNSPTAEMLNGILLALDSNLCVFFEFLIEQSQDEDSKDVMYHRILQRALSGPHRVQVESMLRLLDRVL